MQGSEQVRQAFSKRKKGLVLKSYQLYRLTDAKVGGRVGGSEGSVAWRPALFWPLRVVCCPSSHALVHRCTQVFMFVCNDKGSTWAYSTPGFGAPLAPALLKELREMAKVPDQGKFFTEVRKAGCVWMAPCLCACARVHGRAHTSASGKW